MKILIVSKCPTHPTDAGNRWWILSQAETFMSMGHEVHFLYIQELPMRKDKAPYIESFQKTKDFWGKRFHLFDVSKLEKFKFNLTEQYRKRYCSNHQKVDDNYPRGLARMVNRLDAQYHFDICVINYYYLSRLFEHISIPKKAIATHDAIAYKDLKIGHPILNISADTEAKAMQRCPHIFALQEQEADYFQLLSPQSKVYNLFGKYQHYPQPISNNHNIMFLSGNNEFNQNGIKWFIKEVFPLVLKRFPDAKLKIGGGICKVMPELKNLEGVDMLGYVDSLDEFYRLGDVAINPVYQGTGLKIKTFEALSYDKVTLVHPHSMAGVYKKNEAPLFASEKPEEWVKFLETVWDNPKRIEEIKKHNAAYMKEMNEFIISEYKRFLEA